MKPILLKMTAFGPYKNEETIDFAKLQERKLFVISGQTGAGKTSIFDAISFALYGFGSGQDRKDIKLLRSDFAEDHVHTSVEFIFELRNKKYRVLRQLPHVKKGRKTATGEKYELFEIYPNGEEVPVVERQRVSDINQKLEEIIGLTYDQFNQIVMLPQGEFRKLLTSQTENKEEILRKIFKTDRYGEMAEKLEEKKRHADQQLNEAKALKNSYISQIEGALPKRESLLFTTLSQHSNVYQILEGLSEEQQFYHQKIIEDEQNYQKAFQLHQDKYKVFVANQKLNEQIDEFEKKKEKLHQLESQKSFFDEIKNTMEAANRASRIIPIYSQLVELQKEKIAMKEKLANVTSQLEQANKNLATAQENYSQEVAKEGEREKVNERVKELERLLPLYEQINQQTLLVQQLGKEKNMLEEQLQQCEKQLFEKKEAIQTISAKIEQLEKSVDSLNDLLQQQRTIKEIVDTFIQYNATLSKVLQLQKEREKATALYEEAKKAYELEESNWLSNQAALLAANLLPGMPCPVCGSTEHKTEHKEEVELIEQDTLKKLKADLEKAQQSMFASEANLVAQQNQLKEIENKLQILAAPVEEEQTFVDQFQRVTTAINEKEREKEELLSCKKQLKILQEQQLLFENQYKEMEQRYNDCREKYTQEHTILEQLKKSIPEELQELTQLKETLRKAVQLKNELRESWERVQQQYQDAKTLLATSEEAFKQTTEQVKTIEEKCQKADGEFQTALHEAGFDSTEAFINAKRTDKEIEQLQKQYENYSKELHSLQIQVKDEEEKLKGKEKIDLTEAEEELNRLKSDYEKALDTLNYSRACEQHCIDFADKLEKIANEIFQMEEKSNHIVNLYNLLRGQNSKRISFERYVQMGYLELITEACNVRLKNLSNGQYYLQVSERLESHGRQSGLSLDVYDTYTGQARDVKTLSGGEKFNASLSLALGMADVIQSFQGNVDIDTMFIDEGFGSLDEESLMKAIDTLIDLQKSGRMIGVISHVEELKSAMPAILQVEKLKEGYSKTSILIK